jgi:outer membrane protein assembly factor BamE (lipoprotein component of BamABCDE complex)
MRHRLTALSIVLAFAVSLAACSALSTGRDFPSPKPGAEIKNGTTTKADLLKMYGDPTQVGMKDGDQTWTYYFWKKGSGKEGDLAKQLDITFNAQGIVKSNSFSSNFPEDMKTR